MGILGISKNGIEVFNHPQSHLHFEGSLLKEVIGKLVLEGTYHFETVDMGRTIGKTYLVETDSWKKTFMMERPYSYEPLKLRNGKSRMSFGYANPTKFVTVGLCVCNDTEPEEYRGKWVIFTVFEGEPGEKEPWDRAFEDNKNPEGLEKSIKFWENHALVLTDKEEEYVVNKLKEDDEFFKYVYNCCQMDIYEIAKSEVLNKKDLHCLSCVSQMFQEDEEFEEINSWNKLIEFLTELYEEYKENPKGAQERFLDF